MDHPKEFQPVEPTGEGTSRLLRKKLMPDDKGQVRDAGSSSSPSHGVRQTTNVHEVFMENEDIGVDEGGRGHGQNSSSPIRFPQSPICHPEPPLAHAPPPQQPSQRRRSQPKGAPHQYTPHVKTYLDLLGIGRRIHGIATFPQNLNLGDMDGKVNMMSPEITMFAQD
uniref:Uncharacterized protein n=1 Tax=Cannabis sativa TaxID=3483 RepID=A0A803Q4H4_CANSA